ncbi:hypothetical protein EMCRGX_G013769 [Ephydatia muelleri]
MCISFVHVTPALCTSVTVEHVDASRDKVTLIINQAFEQLHQTIEERKKTLLSEMEAISLSKTTALTLQKEQVMKMQDEIGRYTEMISHILLTHTDQEMIALGDLLPTELNATLKKVENISLDPNVYSNIYVSLYTDSLIKELSIVGHITDLPLSLSQSRWSVAKVKDNYIVKVETMTAMGERYPYGGLQVKAKLRSKSHDGAVVPGEVEDYRDGTYTINLTPRAAGPHQLLITMDGQHVLKSPFHLHVRKNYRSLCNPDQVIHCSLGPTAIAIHDSGNIYVTCFKDDNIRVFDQAGKQKRIIGSGGKDYGNHLIQKLTTRGQLLQTFGQHGSGKEQFKYPTSVTVDQRDRLMHLLTINNGAYDSPAFLQHPLSLALDPAGNIHITAYSSSTIKVFTLEGTYVRSYGDVKGPTGIVIDEEGYSLVNERNGDCLSIFDPRGNKIHTIGNLNKPRGVFLDANSGCLYVANFGANTVLKYSL